MLENAQKRDQTYQQMLKNNEGKILELTDKNQKIVAQLMSKDALLKEFEQKFSQLREEVNQNEKKVESIPQETQSDLNIDTLADISARLQAVTRGLKYQLPVLGENGLLKGESK